jgi:hypothetical protein
MGDGSGAHAGRKYGVLAKVQETGSKGLRDLCMEAWGSRRHPTMKDAQSSGAVNAIEEKAND